MIAIPREINSLLMILVLSLIVLLINKLSDTLTQVKDKKVKRGYIVLILMFGVIGLSDLIELIVYLLSSAGIQNREVFGVLMSWRVFLLNCGLSFVLYKLNNDY